MLTRNGKRIALARSFLASLAQNNPLWAHRNSVLYHRLIRVTPLWVLLEQILGSTAKLAAMEGTLPS